MTAPNARPWRRWIKRIGLVLLGLVVAVIGYLVLRPVTVSVPADAAQPAADYATAMARFGALRQAEEADPGIRSDCYSQIYDHGARTQRVVVLFHGYTNCPKQFAQLAGELYGQGWTVFVPRAPHHGMAEGAPGVMGSITADQLRSYADASVDIASGLGEQVSVLGLSGGGTVTSYVAQHRDVALAVPIAAFLGIPAVPAPLTPQLVNFLDAAPAWDIRDSTWDDPTRPKFPHGVADTTTHGAAAYMTLGNEVFGAASTSAPAASRVVVVINDADDTVNNPRIEDLLALWQAKAPSAVSAYHFDASLKVLHDLVTPDRPGAKPELTYPVLLQILGGG